MTKHNSAPDPVSAAMSAIENALNLADADLSAIEHAAPTPPLVPPKAIAGSPVLKPSPPPAEQAPLLRPSAPSDSDLRSSISPAPPANDDRESVGAIVQALNVGPASRAPFAPAAIGSLFWAALCALYAYLQYGPTVQGAPIWETLVRPETPLLALAALGPIFIMFGFAALSRRLAELRQ